jgi:hypothetical protein
MEFGLFTEFQCPPGMQESRAFDESIAQMCAAEDEQTERVAPRLA